AAPKDLCASICDILSFPTAGRSSSQPTSPIDALAPPSWRTAREGSKIILGHRKPGRRLSVEPTAPGGVPPSPQPLTHPAIDPGPLGRGLPCLGRGSKSRARTRPRLRPPPDQIIAMHHLGATAESED